MRIHDVRFEQKSRKVDGIPEYIDAILPKIMSFSVNVMK